MKCNVGRIFIYDTFSWRKCKLQFHIKFPESAVPSEDTINKTVSLPKPNPWRCHHAAGVTSLKGERSSVHWGVKYRTKVAWHWVNNRSVVNYLFGALRSIPLYQYLPHAGGYFLFPSSHGMKMEHKNKRVLSILSLHPKVDPSKQGASSSGISPHGAYSISQPKKCEMTTTRSCYVS